MNTATQTAYSYFGRKNTSQVFLKRHPGDVSQLIASHWSAILLWNNDGKIPSDNKDNTPEQNTNVDPPLCLPQQHNNNPDDNNNPEPFNTPPSSPHPPGVPMPDDPHTPHPGLPPDDDDLFTHRFNHHHDQMMTHQMRKCIHHRMNLQTYHRIRHLHQIIHNRRCPEPKPYLFLQTQLLCPIRLFRQTLKIHQ